MVILFFLLVSWHMLAANEPSITVDIPMRDGFLLPTDMYFPTQEKPENCPCILIRSPAGRKNRHATRYAAFVQHSYVIAIQDTRSAADPEGKTFPGTTDGWGEKQDGYDTIEWLASSRFSNGKIGTAGVSALGITQYLLAPTDPPSLKCQHVGVAASSMYHHALCPGGQLLKDQVEGWLGLYAKDSGVHSLAYCRCFHHEFWNEFDSNAQAHRVTVPAIHYGGWYDTFLQGTIDGFVSRQEFGGKGALGTQKLVIGPWTHFWPESKRLGDFEVPKEGARPPADIGGLEWFDYHLKGKLNSIEHMPAVTYYVMGAFDGSHRQGNVWRFSDRWPPKSIETSFYLFSSGKLRESRNNENDAVVQYMHHPLNPVPTIGGRNLFIESGPKDQRQIEEREDVLVFTSQPLEDNIEVTGQIHMRLYFSSNCKDTDIAVRLTDVYPDGRSILIADGMFRTGQKMLESSHFQENPMEIDIDLSATSIVFAKGHKIRVSVSGSNYPKYERNYNLGFVGAHKGGYMIAENRIHIGRSYPSRLILPIVNRFQ